MWFDLMWIGKKHMDKSLFEGFLWSVKLCVAEGEKTNLHHLQRERKVEGSNANAHRTFVKLMARFIFWPDAFIFRRSYFNSLCPRIMLMHRTNLSRPKLIVVLRLWSRTERRIKERQK